MTFRAPVVFASLARSWCCRWLARPLIGRRAAACSSPGCWRSRRCSRSTAAWCGRTGDRAAGAGRRRSRCCAGARAGGCGGGLRLAVLARALPLVPSRDGAALAAPFGLLVIETRRGAARVDALAIEQPRATPRDLAIAAVSAPLLVGAFMVPAWQSLRDLYAAKSGIARFSFELVPPIARLQAGAADGTAEIAVTVLFWCAGRGRVRRPGAPARAARALPDRRRRSRSGWGSRSWRRSDCSTRSSSIAI